MVQEKKKKKIRCIPITGKGLEQKPEKHHAASENNKNK